MKKTQSNRPTTKHLRIKRLVVAAAFLLLAGDATIALAQVYNAIESRTIRDTDDTGPNFIQVVASHLEVDERPGDARRVVIEFEVPSPACVVVAASVKLYQQNWPNDDVTWYVAPDNDGLVHLNDWFATGALASGSFSRSSSGIDMLNVTSALQTLMIGTDPYFRVGLRMTNSVLGHALFDSHTSANPPQLVVTCEVIFQDGFESGDTSIWGGTSANMIPFVQLDGLNWLEPSQPNLLDGRWHHFAASKTGDTLTYYSDGQITGTLTDTAIGAASLATNHPLLIGWDQFTANFDGIIDEVCIWDVARTPAEILTDMGGGLAGTETGLVAHWTMDECQGQTAEDLVANQDGRLGTSSSADSADPTWVSAEH